MEKTEEILKEYHNEVALAADSAYAWRYLNHRAATDDSFYKALCSDAIAHSWNLIVCSLYTTFFTVLGRLFDNSEKSLRVTDLIKQCKNSLDECKKSAECNKESAECEDVDEFKKSEFAKRRIAGNHGVRPGYLDEYLPGVYEPSAADFDELAKNVAQCQGIYEEKYKPIRNKLIAHKDLKTFPIRATLFSKTDEAEVEQILSCLEGVSTIIRELLQQTDLPPPDRKQRVEQDMKQLFDKLLGL